MRREAGFTLVEILIVVVIIAVLAALIIPRVLDQPEKGALAEANSILGAIVRAQNMYVDSGANFQWVACSGTGTGWGTIGMSGPSSAKYTYACTATSCTATRAAGTGDYAGAVITVTYGDTLTWDCAGGTSTKKYAALSTGACTT